MLVSKAKKVLSVLVILLLTISITPGSKIAEGAVSKTGFSTPTSQTTTVGTVTASVLNVRNSYGTNAKIIGTLTRGSNAYIISNTQGWYKISFNLKTGWVCGVYLSNIRPTPSATPGGTASTTSSQNSSTSSAANSGVSSAAESSPAPTSSTPAPSAASSAASASSTRSTSSVSSTTSSAPAQGIPVSTLPAKIMAGYYTSWSAYSGFTPDKIKPSMINVIHYAFAGIGSDLRITAGDPGIDYSNFSKLAALKKSSPGLKTILSVGGWDGSSRFSDMALTDASRKTFAQSCVGFIKQYGFDGIDIDWEYPVSGGCTGRPEDRTNFTLLMQALRGALTAQGNADGNYYYLTFAGGASNSYIQNVQLSQLANIVDYAVDMTYDLHGPWDAYTDFNAPLYTPAESSPQYKISVDSSIQSWRSAGFPAVKLVMGVPFYGYLYSGVSFVNNGLYQRFTSAKAIGYDSIVSTCFTNAAFAPFYHTVGQVPYLFGNGQFISYDDAASIAKKAQYASVKGLRGVSAWELSYDRSSALLGAAFQNLH